jgi:hypothetical protein
MFLKKHGEIEIQITSTNSLITNIDCSKFLGINIDSSLSWKNHFTALSLILNKACFAMRSIQPFVIRCNEDGLPLLYRFDIEV